MTLPLRARLAVSATVVFAVLIGALAVASYTVLARQLDADASARLEELTEGLHGYLRFHDDVPSVEFDASDGDQVSFVQEATRYYQIYEAGSGRLLFQSSALAPLGLRMTPERVRGSMASLRPFDVAYCPDWHLATGVLAAVSARIDAARETLPEALRANARLIFTAHSIPTSMPAADRYVLQLRDSATAVAALQRAGDWALVFQSRSGRPEDPWLEPDVNDYLREARSGGLEAAILVPIGFLADHVEVLYDLDVEARATADAIGLPLARAEAVNDHPRFIDALADVVMDSVARYGRGRPLSIVPAEPPAKRELPPPVKPAAAR